MDLDIRPIETNKNKIVVNALMKDCTIPKFPQSVLMVGASSSGKTTLLLNLMTRDNMYKGYHDFVFLFSLTAKLDDSFKKLKIKKDFIFDTEDEMIKNLNIIYKSQYNNVEKMGIDKSPKMLLIFEDLTTNKKLIKSTIFKSLWTLGRHLNMQVISMIHKYKALGRTERLNAMNIIYFRGSLDETRQLVEDFTPPGHTKREFTQMVDYATSPDKGGDHNFIYMCNKLPFKIKFRKNFTTIMELQK